MPKRTATSCAAPASDRVLHPQTHYPHEFLDAALFSFLSSAYAWQISAEPSVFRGPAAHHPLESCAPQRDRSHGGANRLQREGPAFISMTILAIISFGFSLLAGVAALCRAATRAPEGYEDELGFHTGIEPRSQGTTTAAARVHSMAGYGGEPDFYDRVEPWSPKTAGSDTPFPSNKCVPTHVHGAL